MVTLNAKWKKDMMALNAELKKNNDSERQTKDTTLNAKRKKDMMDLNVNNK